MKDPYLYPGSEILINLYDERNEQRLAEIEAAYTTLRIRQLCDIPIIGIFNFEHLCRIHQFIFQDVFYWAGQPRIINIEKAEAVLGGISIEYSDVGDIAKYAADICEKMNNTSWKLLHTKEKAEQFSKYMSELWKIHPFREGNTRTIITFCCDFAEHNGFQFNRELFKENSVYVRRALVAATAIFSDIGDRSQPQHLIKIVSDAIV